MSKFLSTMKLKLQKNAPSIALVAGTAGLVGTIALSNYQTLKVQPVIDDIKEQWKLPDEGARLAKREDYTQEDYTRDKVVIAAQSIVKMTKHYRWSILLGTASIASIVYGRNAYEGRVVALTAAYTVTKEAFDRYRAKMAADLGEDQEQALYEDSELSVEKKNGKITGAEIPKRSTGRFFDDTTSTEFLNNPDANMNFIKQQQNFFNHKLQLKGYVFLNEVYEALGFDTVPEGQILGWYVKPGEKHEKIDFFDKANVKRSDKLVSAITSEQVSPLAVWLDFNIDGVIHTLL